MQTDLELPEGIDPAVALQLAKHGGSLLCLDVPPGTQIGIDLATYTVGGKFKGIKMIPPGVHFVSFAAVSKEGDMAPRTGRFLWFQQGQVHAWRWNPATEDFLCGPELGEGEAERYAEGVRRFEFDQFLGTYPLKTYARWQTLSRYITKDLLSRTEPIGGKVASTQALLDGAGAAGSSSGMGSKQETKESELEEKKKALAEEALELEIRGGETLFLSAIPFTGAGVAPEKRTEFALDTSRSLLTLCSK
ncbi:AAR2 [Symbiodinium sp. KB8]|nr:AAR2 [Symbiodinium sp. KB8]